MRILHIIPTLSGGGAECQLSYLSVELSRLGHEVHIAYCKDGPDRPAFPGVKLHRLTAYSNYDPSILPKLVHLIYRLGPHIVHTWILQMDIFGGIAAMIAGTPWVLRESTSVFHYSGTWKQRLRLWLGTRASALVSNSRGGDEYWRGILPNRRRHLIENGLPLESIELVLPELPPGIAGHAGPIVLHVGRLIESKNVRAFLVAFSEVTRRRTDVVAVLCGDGVQRGELERLCASLGIGENVVFLGHVPSSLIWSLMKAASALVSLSSYEGRPNVVLEAIACECPLVLSDIPAHHDIVDDRYGLFVDASSTQQTVSAILDSVANVRQAKERLSLWKQECLSSLSITTMARKYESVYTECM